MAIHTLIGKMFEIDRVVRLSAGKVVYVCFDACHYKLF